MANTNTSIIVSGSGLSKYLDDIKLEQQKTIAKDFFPEQ